MTLAPDVSKLRSTANGAMHIQHIVERVKTYAPNAEIGLVMEAYLFAANAHNGQMRRSGEDYLTHPLAVAGILADMRMDVDTIATGLLHDTMEDCLTTRSELVDRFNDEVAELVDGVTKIGKLEFRSKEQAQAENFRKLVLAMGKDIRVILVKLADRLHNMRTMEHMKPEKQRQISQETLDIYAPIANRLGLSKLKMELEDLCFRYLHPDIHAELTDKLGEGHEAREAYSARTAGLIRTHLGDRGISADVTGRSKHIHSIYRKMCDQNLDFEQLYDLTAFRVIVDNLGECYTVLGMLHGLWRPLPDRLKDYIANPKSNGYQSLHTCLMGPEATQIEVQIRTEKMHSIAELGIAAHWRYKEGHLALSRDDVGKIARLRAVLEAAQEIDDSSEFFETAKVDLFSNEIFVFTPRGDVKIFPVGATALDFAYAVHSEVGNTCTGARVNGRMVPIRHKLANGDTIDIITRKDQRPSRDWVQWAQTGRALNKIRRAVREEERARGRGIGKELLENELRKRGLGINKLIRSGKLADAAKKLGQHRAEDLYLALAQGSLTMPRVLAYIVPPELLEEPEVEEPGPLQTFINKVWRRSESPVTITGEQDVLVNFARCCNPLPGEPVQGFITRGRGITVHRAACPQLLDLEEERRIPVQWQRKAGGTHPGQLSLLCANTPGMLAEIGGICKTLGINVTHMQARSLEDEKAELTLEVAVNTVSQLDKLIRLLERIKGVIRVDRVQAVHQRS